MTNLRKARGLSQEKLAERMGIDEKYLGFIERGRANPTLEVLLRLAEMLKVDLDLMFNYRWAALRETELRKKIKALADGDDADCLPKPWRR